MPNGFKFLLQSASSYSFLLFKYAVSCDIGMQSGDHKSEILYILYRIKIDL